MKFDFDNFPYHIIFAGAYPVLALYSYNISETALSALAGASVFSVWVTAVVTVVSLLIGSG